MDSATLRLGGFHKVMELCKESQPKTDWRPSSEVLRVGAEVGAPWLKRMGRITRIDHEEASVNIE